MTTIIDGTAGITFPNSTVQASAGQVLQVVNATVGTEVTNSTSTYADTGLTATITPQFSTSKILVLISQNGVVKETNNTGANLRLMRGASSILQFTNGASFTNDSSSNNTSASISYLDSPATTSATTYKTQFASQNNNAIVKIQLFGGGATSTITLMEIAA